LEVRKLKFVTRDTAATRRPKVGDSSVPRVRHSDRSTYVPPPLRRPSSATPQLPTPLRKPLLAEVQQQEMKDTAPKKLPPGVETLKWMLERELPQAEALRDRQKGDGEEKQMTPSPRPTLPPCGDSKVDDWLTRNEASQAAMEELEDPVFESTPVSSSSPLFVTPAKAGSKVQGMLKTSYREVTRQETHDSLSVLSAQAELAKLLARAPHSPSSLMTTRESSQVLQRLIAVLPSASLQPILNIVLGNFRALATNR
jgi:hypothetical protein